MTVRPDDFLPIPLEATTCGPAPSVPRSPRVVGHLRQVLRGPAVPFTRPGSRSGILKRPVAHPVTVSMHGLEGDEQGDLRVHGGPDKAVHVYPWAHYGTWRQLLADNGTALALLAGPGAFGENFSVQGTTRFDEHTVCLGDRWRIGDQAEFEVSQGRQPCWKLNDRFAQPDMAAQLQRSLRTGWYLRVLTPGDVQAGDAIHLVDRPHEAWPLARLLDLIANRRTDPQTLREALALPLPPSWTKLFNGRLESGQIESWAGRMSGP
jgi:MOSC domain-containing protein YiiM